MSINFENFHAQPMFQDPDYPESIWDIPNGQVYGTTAHVSLSRDEDGYNIVAGPDYLKDESGEFVPFNPEYPYVGRDGEVYTISEDTFDGELIDEQDLSRVAYQYTYGEGLNGWATRDVSRYNAKEGSPLLYYRVSHGEVDESGEHDSYFDVAASLENGFELFMRHDPANDNVGGLYDANLTYTSNDTVIACQGNMCEVRGANGDFEFQVPEVLTDNDPWAATNYAIHVLNGYAEYADEMDFSEPGSFDEFITHHLTVNGATGYLLDNYSEIGLVDSQRIQLGDDVGTGESVRMEEN
ncbi:hypothetical protein GF362_01880 [Candidatus Dojkabacteria bacterium]|nr:hypothetical protein [Candidatus Dojkabacteria bacterium]